MESQRPTRRNKLRPVGDAGPGRVSGTVALMAFKGGHVSDVRADSRASGAASVVLPMRAKSLAIGIGHDWDRAASRTLINGQRLIHETKTSLQDTMWVQQVGVSGIEDIRIGTSSPRDDRWSFVAVAIARVRIHGDGDLRSPSPSPSETAAPPPRRARRRRRELGLVDATPTPSRPRRYADAERHYTVADASAARFGREAGGVEHWCAGGDDADCRRAG